MGLFYIDAEALYAFKNRGFGEEAGLVNHHLVSIKTTRHLALVMGLVVDLAPLRTPGGINNDAYAPLTAQLIF